MAELTSRETHFEFGQNWADFAQSIDEQRITAAIDGVRKLIPDLRGKTFLDIGCGSGLSSLAALKLGAREVFAVDIDEKAVATTKTLLASCKNWRAEQLSVFELDPEKHGRFDVVYSWGVLHHTGDMWRAIKHAATMVKPGGLYVIAIYERTERCGFWAAEKRFYKRAPKPAQKVARAIFMSAFMLALMRGRKNPIKYVRHYREKRGMRWSNDVHDWLGGYPYESASSNEVRAELRSLGFSEVRLFTISPSNGLFGTGCSEFVSRLDDVIHNHGGLHVRVRRA